MAQILIVEDSSIQAELLRRVLADAGYRVSLARDGAAGLAQAQAQRPDLLISDINMPVMDGFELCQRIRHDPELCTLPVILLTAMSDVQDVVRGLNAGADNYVTKPYDPALLLSRVRDSLNQPSQVAAELKLPLQARLGDEVFEVHTGSQQMLNLLLSIYRNALEQNKLLQATQDQLTELNGKLQQEVETQSAALIEHERKLGNEREMLLKKEAAHFHELHDTLLESVTAIAATVEMRDPYTSGHQRRVANLAVLIGAQLQLSAHDLEGLQIASAVHDVGKIRIPSEILTKPSKLDRVEFDFIKTHSQTGYEILKNIHFPWPIAEVVLQHHERLDGSGYPRGLEGDEILLEARILAVADVVESMSTSRPYRKSLGVEAAIAEIQAGRATKFDPLVVDAFIAVHDQGRWSPEVA
ncbi:HD domain-containing phosphohydrolase [uncultured Thiodictyon sp.]|uniref:HD domain-containing phosphohydrolase n=1 Tax=uncultured Thiodictyon sp. TaxID=1846217 RepID=UPI0025F2F8DE|nr:HD domain-containing phosphohydrolase [uncultured Thiodictyon sp.]